MAQKVQVTMTCDLSHPGGKEVKADSTAQFSVDGVEYEIDVCGTHDKQLHRAFAAYAEHGRNAGRTRHLRSVKGSARRSPGRSTEIRAWARETGIDVPSRGRIPNTVVNQYESRNQVPSPKFSGSATA